jgi:hypothetical protein
MNSLYDSSYLNISSLLNQCLISNSASCKLAEACIKLNTDIHDLLSAYVYDICAKSHLIVPGVADFGSVDPTIFLTYSTASTHSTTIASTGVFLMYSTTLFKRSSHFLVPNCPIPS